MFLLARPLRGRANKNIFQLAVIFYTLREPFLNETADSPRRRSLTLASQQKSFLCFSFARA